MNQPYLSDEQLFAQYRLTKSPSARDCIIERYRDLSAHLAKKYYNKGVDNEDVDQIACVGLINAVERFDPARGRKFSTFATPTIVGEIKRFFRDKGYFIRVPRRLYDIFARASRIRSRYLQERGEEIGREELARELGVSEKLLDEATACWRTASVSSLEYMESEDGVMTEGMYRIIGEEDDAMLLIENEDMLNRFMGTLTDRERDFIQLRYRDGRTQSDIASRFGVSQMQISRMERRILRLFEQTYLRSV